MKRRSFIKKSVAAAIVAATPLALTGLVNAEGGGGPAGTGSDSTGWFDTTEQETTLPVDIIGNCSQTGVSKVKYCEVEVNGQKRFIYKCEKNGYSFPNYCNNDYVESVIATDLCKQGKCTLENP